MEYIKFILVALVLVFSGCRKDEIIYTPYGSSIGDLDFFLNNTIDPATNSTFELQGGAVVPDTVLTTAGGVRIFLANTDFLFEDAQGMLMPASSCQKIKIEVKESLDKSNWLARLLSSKTDDGHIVDHCGAVYLKITCDGKEVRLVQGRYIKIQVPDNNLKPEKTIHYQPNEGSDWAKGESDSVFWAEWMGKNGNTVTGYELLARNMGWVTATEPFEAIGYATYCVSFPAQFDAENTRVFLVFDNKATVVAMKSVDGAPSRFCLENTPIGASVRIISITKAGPSYYLGDKSTETASDATIQMVPVEKTAAQLSAFISGL